MIYSEKHRYLFLEVPNTASTAMSAELRESYAGEAIGRKHGFYGAAGRILGQDIVNDLFVFCSVRNPLDIWVTRYQKIKNDHKGNYTNPKKFKRNGGWIADEQVEMYEFITQNDASFAEFIAKYPDGLKFNWLTQIEKCNHVVKFEELPGGFTEVLEKIGIEPVRPLPVVNKTSNKKPFLDYYDEAAKATAVKQLSGVMETLGYDFPEDFPVGK